MTRTTDIKLSSVIPPHFHGLYEDFINEKHSHYWLKGGRGSVKSTMASELIVLGIMRNPETHAVCTRRNKVDLHGTVFAQIKKAIHLLNVEHLFKIPVADQGAPPITYKETGQKIYFTGLDDPDGLKSITVPFGYIKYSWYEEIHQLSGMNKIRSANQSIRRGSDERFITFYTYNPPRSKTNWVNEESEKLELRDDFFVSHSTWEMLPEEIAHKWLGPDWIRDATELKQNDYTSYQHEYLGIAVGYGTNVFKNLDITEIDDDVIKVFDNVQGGVDFGFSIDPVAYVRSHYDKARRILYIFDEIFAPEILNRQLAQLILGKCAPGEKVICDSAEPKSIAELREQGVNAHKAKKGPGSVESGTKFLQELNGIVIDKVRCPNTAREFANAEFDTDRFGNVINRLKDENNHSIDATRYRMETEMKRKAGWKTR